METRSRKRSRGQSENELQVAASTSAPSPSTTSTSLIRPSHSSTSLSTPIGTSVSKASRQEIHTEKVTKFKRLSDNGSVINFLPVISPTQPASFSALPSVIGITFVPWKGTESEYPTRPLKALVFKLVEPYLGSSHSVSDYVVGDSRMGYFTVQQMISIWHTVEAQEFETVTLKVSHDAGWKDGKIQRNDPECISLAGCNIASQCKRLGFKSNGEVCKLLISVRAVGKMKGDNPLLAIAQQIEKNSNYLVDSILENDLLFLNGLVPVMIKAIHFTNLQAMSTRQGKFALSLIGGRRQLRIRRIGGVPHGILFVFPDGQHVGSRSSLTQPISMPSRLTGCTRPMLCRFGLFIRDVDNSQLVIAPTSELFGDQTLFTIQGESDVGMRRRLITAVDVWVSLATEADVFPSDSIHGSVFNPNTTMWDLYLANAHKAMRSWLLQIRHWNVFSAKPPLLMVRSSMLIVGLFSDASGNFCNDIVFGAANPFFQGSYDSFRFNGTGFMARKTGVVKDPFVQSNNRVGPTKFQLFLPKLVNYVKEHHSDIDFEIGATTEWNPDNHVDFSSSLTFSLATKIMEARPPNHPSSSSSSKLASSSTSHSSTPASLTQSHQEGSSSFASTSQIPLQESSTSETNLESSQEESSVRRSSRTSKKVVYS